MTGTSSEPTNTAVLLTAATCRSSTAVPRHGTEHSSAFILLVACFLFLPPLWIHSRPLATHLFRQRLCQNWDQILQGSLSIKFARVLWRPPLLCCLQGSTEHNPQPADTASLLHAAPLLPSTAACRNLKDGLHCTQCHSMHTKGLSSHGTDRNTFSCVSLTSDPNRKSKRSFCTRAEPSR